MRIADIRLLEIEFWREPAHIFIINYTTAIHTAQMEGRQIQENQHNESVTTAAFAAKFRSKRGKYAPIVTLILTEIFTFLTVDVKAYLPALHTVTIYFLKDLISGRKKIVPMAHLVHIHVPAYENLSLKVIYEFFEKHTDVLQFLPDGKELLKVPKAWICNVGATVIGEAF